MLKLSLLFMIILSSAAVCFSVRFRFSLIFLSRISNLQHEFVRAWFLDVR